MGGCSAEKSVPSLMNMMQWEWKWRDGQRVMSVTHPPNA
ncbi:uncharacterized protein G2W53_038003 [Senna tora]|uniref:Uncharacterized protein n=1 Tax=Senna tora TaxID=362788 RepID=A0A834SLC7_9FABA|nr:uncharacterized protein G2W53_038003 [Senna tora]